MQVAEVEAVKIPSPDEFGSQSRCHNCPGDEETCPALGACGKVGDQLIDDAPVAVCQRLVHWRHRDAILELQRSNLDWAQKRRKLCLWCCDCRHVVLLYL